MAALRVVLALLLFGAMAALFMALIFVAFWALAMGQVLMAIACFAVLGGWSYWATQRRQPNNPEHFKDYGV